MSEFKHIISYILNGGRNPTLTPANELHKTRILVITSLLLIIGGLPLAIVHLINGIWAVGATVIIAAVMGSLNLYTVFRWNYLTLNAHIAVSILAITVITSNIIWGGYYDPNFGWFYLLPLVAALVINLYAMWFYVGLVTLLFVVFYVLQQKGLLPLHHEVIQNYEILTWFNRLGVAYLSCLVISAFSSERSRYERELEKARMKERMASQAKGTFLATISHEIRTPMTGILGMSELLMHGKLEPEQKNYAKVIHQSGELLLGLLNDVLDYSKIDSGKMTLESAPVNIKTLVEDMLILSSHAAHEKGLEITYYIPPDMPPMLMGDSLRIKQIISNLLSNAIKFTSQGEIHVRIAFNPISEKKVEVAIHIRDTGIGISQINKEKIFEAFTQADSSTSRVYGGTGLGLSIVKHLAAMMGGKVSLQSELGKGSEFSVYLPMDIYEDNRPELPLSTQKIHALCICLNESNQEAVATMLERWNISCQTTHDETIAETMIEGSVIDKIPFQFIITEYRTLSSPTLMKVFNTANVPLIIVLYNAQHDTIRKDDSTLNIVYMEKPIHQSRLYNLIISTLGHRITEQQFSFINNDTPEKLHGKILAAEDNAINQALIKAQLDNLGIEFDMVSNGQEAINAARNKTYDLILMDCHMPVIDGFMATQAIRRMKDNSSHHVPIIALTADALQGDKERCLMEGMDDYIRKPFKREDLIRILNKWLNKDQQGGSDA